VIWIVLAAVIGIAALILALALARMAAQADERIAWGGHRGHR
jgi:type IV secretory pathway TrbD component